MESPAENGSSSRSTPSTGLMPGRILLAYDAFKSPNPQEFRHFITKLFTRGDITQEADIITVFGVMHKVLHPMGFQIQIGSDSFINTRFRAIKQEVMRMVDASVSVLHLIAKECERNGINIEVKIVVGSPMEKVLVQEAVASNATWVVLDRHLKKEARFYLKHMPCKVGLVRDDLSLEILRPNYHVKAPKIAKHKLFYTSSKMVPLPLVDYNENIKRDTICPSYRESLISQETSDTEKISKSSSITLKSSDQTPDDLVSYPGLVTSCNWVEPKSSQQLMQGKSNGGDNFKLQESEYDDLIPKILKEKDLHIYTDGPKSDQEMRTGINSVRYNYSEIKKATDDFSSINLLGEVEFGDVYKGQLKDGQFVAIKVQKGEYTEEELSEFRDEIRAISLACHKNVAMLLGYCSDESGRQILVYEHACNKSLEWHLFDNADNVLTWYQRHAIAIGIAKGLRYLHEECKGGPLVSRNLRLSNVFLTHDLIPMLRDCGIATLKHRCSGSKNSIDSHGYLAPEYSENRVFSVKTDTYAFGIILLQLISGHKAFDPKRGSLAQWALPLIKMTAIDELVDRRLGDSFSSYEVYQMSKAAELCLRAEPDARPAIGHVLHVLEGTNNHIRDIKEQMMVPLHILSKRSSSTGA